MCVCVVLMGRCGQVCVCVCVCSPDGALWSGVCVCVCVMSVDKNICKQVVQRPGVPHSSRELKTHT